MEEFTKDLFEEDLFLDEEGLPNIGSPEFSYNYCEEVLPYDVLLDLCKKGKVDILDVHLSDVTDKYISYVNSLENKNYSNISSFLILAASLLELKSAALLPVIEVEDDNIDYEYSDSELQLLRGAEYGMFKDIAEKLDKMQIYNRFYREPKFDEKDFNIIIKSFNISKMIGAFELLLEKNEFLSDDDEPKTIIKERFTVADRVKELIEEIRAYKLLGLYDLFRPDYTKMEIINTFLAVLEILKKQIAVAEQAGLGEEIIIKYTPETDNLDNDEEEVLKDVELYN